MFSRPGAIPQADPLLSEDPGLSKDPARSGDPGPDVAWSPLGPGDVSEVAALMRRVLDADGGLPEAADAGFLARRWTGPGVEAVAGRGPDGVLVAAGSARPAGSGVSVVGVVDPAAVGRGLGADLLDWGLEAAVRRGAAVTVESESVTSAAESLFASRGLRRTFAEDILGIDPMALRLPARQPPALLTQSGWAAGTTLVEWTDATAGRFHDVYRAAFRERPGFPDQPAGQWITDTVQDTGFRPDFSLLASRPDLGDVGFVTATTAGIEQVGVVPRARRGGLGAALIGEVLRRMRAGGVPRAVLTVNVDNPAGRLYRRLGFVPQGRRARYAMDPCGTDGGSAVGAGTTSV